MTTDEEDLGLKRPFPEPEVRSAPFLKAAVLIAMFLLCLLFWAWVISVAAHYLSP